MAKPSRRCGTKRGYTTLDQARAAAARLAAARARQGNPVVSFLQAYGCSCGKYHFGSTRQIDWGRVAAYTVPTKEHQ